MIVSVYTLSAGRIGAIIAAVLGLSGAFMSRRRPAVALSLGSISLILGGLVVATANGGIGTGNGVGGGIVAMVIGAIDVALGVLGKRKKEDRQDCLSSTDL